MSIKNTAVTISTSAEAGRLTSPDVVRTFVLSHEPGPQRPLGAVFTLRGRTGVHFTYRIERKEALSEAEAASGLARWWVHVLTGPENSSTDCYDWLGTVRAEPAEPGQPARGARFYHGAKSRLSHEAQSAQAFKWLWEQLFDKPESWAVRALEKIEFWHEGKCGRCGRRLSKPQSIATGLGPVCANRVDD